MWRLSVDVVLIWGSSVLEAIERMLELDPGEEVETRLEIAKRMLRRAREELGRGDPVQASEKLYRAVEECIKILACLEGLDMCRRARGEGGWWTKLLAQAASRLAQRLGEKLVLEAWLNAYDLHVHGFHEHAYTVEDIEPRVEVVERLITYTKNRLKQQDHHTKT